VTQHAQRKQRFTLTTRLGTVDWTSSAHQTDKHVLRWTRRENVRLHSAAFQQATQKCDDQ